MADRIDQIMKVDAAALLNTIKDIETQLSEYNRQDKIPPWAAALMNRVDRLEDGHGGIGSPKKDNRTTSATITMQDLSNDDRILSKVRSEMDAEILTMKLNFEAKISSLSLEVDRLNKLLQIRPTVSELQQVALGIQQLDSRINSTMSDVSQTVKINVQQKVTEELSTIHEEMKHADNLTRETMVLLSNRVDSFQSDIKDIRSGVDSFTAGIKESVSKFDNSVHKLGEENASLRRALNEQHDMVQQAFSEVRFAQQMQNDVFADYKGATSSRLLNMEENIRQTDTLLKASLQDMENSIKESDKRVFACEDELKTFRSQYSKEHDVDEVKISECISGIVELNKRLTEAEAFIERVKDEDVIGTLNYHKTNLFDHNNRIQEQLELISALQERSVSQENETQHIQSDIGNIKLNAKEQRTLIEEHTEHLQTQQGAISVLQNSMQNADKDLGRLFVIVEEISVLRDQGTSTEQRLKSHQGTITTLLENIDDHDKRIEQIVELMDRSGEDLQRKMDEIRSSMMDMLKEKQAEMDASLENMKDNLDIMSSAGEGSISLGGIKGRSSVLSSRGKSISVGGAADAGAASGVFSLEQQQAVAKNQAQFMADLCNSFEEIAVKKTFVPEIPPAMREQITSMCQELTQFLAVCTDAEMVQILLQDLPDSIEYSEGSVSEKRSAKLEDFVESVRGIVSSHHPQPGVIRHDAREKFLKQLHKALDLCMSKHDQVLSIGNSRLGRIKIPTCIACDRPLTEKVRVDSMVSNTEAVMRAMEKERSDLEQSSWMSTKSNNINNNYSNNNNNNKMIPMKGGGGGGGKSAMRLPPAAIPGRPMTASQELSNTAYVLRSGFKMPKPMTSNGISNSNVPASTSSMSQSQSLDAVRSALSMSVSLPDLKVDRER